MGFVANFICFPAVQKLWKSVKVWQSYREFKGGNFFETQCRSGNCCCEILGLFQINLNPLFLKLSFAMTLSASLQHLLKEFVHFQQSQFFQLLSRCHNHRLSCLNRKNGQDTWVGNMFHFWPRRTTASIVSPTATLSAARLKQRRCCWTSALTTNVHTHTHTSAFV